MNARRRHQLELSLGAEAEMYAAEVHYHRVSEDTAPRFRQALRKTFETILEDPRANRRGPRGSFRCRVKGFPYIVYYTDDPAAGLVEVWAVAHEKRRQGYWTHRMP